MTSIEQLQHLAERAERSAISDSGWKTLAFVGAHAPIGLLVFAYPPAATLHAVLTMTVGLWLAAFGKKLRLVACAGAYIVGAEVLWRMARANMLWEMGKYGIVLLFLVALVRMRSLSPPVQPAIYLLLLLPSIIPVLMDLGLSESRRPISFNLSGPLALLVSAWFFTHLKLNLQQFQKLCLSFMAPVFAIGVFVLLATMTNPDLVFTGESNRGVTGGFGPNQVSAALGAGALLAFMCVLYDKRNPRRRFLLIGLFIFFVAQAAITFSRGGLYNLAGAGLLACAFLLRDSSARLKLAGLAVLLYVIGAYVLFPQIDAFSGGALQARLENVDPTGRVELFVADMEIWSSNPILGVGPGQATELREEIMLVAHTEFSRLLSEHGVFGLAALVMLLITGWKNLKRSHLVESKALVAASIGWSFIFMLNAAMRMAAPSFFFGLAFATFLFTVRKDALVLPPGIRIQDGQLSYR
jgi:O-antigen ligase